jgi:hypothetical protein
MVEIDDRIIRPQPGLDLAGDDRALPFNEHPQDLKHLFSEDDPIVRSGCLNRSQLASAEIELKGSTTDCSVNCPR